MLFAIILSVSFDLGSTSNRIFDALLIITSFAVIVLIAPDCIFIVGLLVALP